MLQVEVILAFNLHTLNLQQASFRHISINFILNWTPIQKLMFHNFLCHVFDSLLHIVNIFSYCFSCMSPGCIFFITDLPCGLTTSVENQKNCSELIMQKLMNTIIKVYHYLHY